MCIYTCTDIIVIVLLTITIIIIIGIAIVIIVIIIMHVYSSHVYVTNVRCCLLCNFLALQDPTPQSWVEVAPFWDQVTGPGRSYTKPCRNVRDIHTREALHEQQASKPKCIG